MAMKTKAAVLVETGAPLQILELEIPPLKPGQVLVDVAFSGVCHSQLNEVNGKRGPDRFLPHALGHEGSGTVVDVGEGVRKVKIGDKVVLTWIKGEGADVPGTVYGSEIGPINSGAISTFMNRTVTCENRVIPIAENMPLREAALLGCAIPTGGGMVLNTAKAKEGDVVAVFGAGGIGLCAITVAAMRGAKTIIALDVSDDKLSQAKKLGATHAVNVNKKDALEAIQELTSGKGADFCIEAAGLRQVMESAFKSVRDGGGLCILAGNVALGEQISIDPFDLIKGKQIVGSWGGATVPDHDIPLYSELYVAGKLKLDGLITHSFSLADINQALEGLASGKVGRAIIELG